MPIALAILLFPARPTALLPKALPVMIGARCKGKHPRFQQPAMSPTLPLGCRPRIDKAAAASLLREPPLPPRLVKAPRPPAAAGVLIGPFFLISPCHSSHCGLICVVFLGLGGAQLARARQCNWMLLGSSP
ncbi:MAG: hypothetical protein J3K34DRAFT_432578 [Monoraphidium minutum]|nr:MAG: hypothetical protein J3K34DRAFT_432578 [Monoraphidium minutum]